MPKTTSSILEVSEFSSPVILPLPPSIFNRHINPLSLTAPPPRRARQPRWRRLPLRALNIAKRLKFRLDSDRNRYWDQPLPFDIDLPVSPPRRPAPAPTAPGTLAALDRGLDIDSNHVDAIVLVGFGKWWRRQLNRGANNWRWWWKNRRANNWRWREHGGANDRRRWKDRRANHGGRWRRWYYTDHSFAHGFRTVGRWLQVEHLLRAMAFSVARHSVTAFEANVSFRVGYTEI